jgi:hypothetical protein
MRLHIVAAISKNTSAICRDRNESACSTSAGIQILEVEDAGRVESGYIETLLELCDLHWQAIICKLGAVDLYAIWHNRFNSVQRWLRSSGTFLKTNECRIQGHELTGKRIDAL